MKLTNMIVLDYENGEVNVVPYVDKGVDSDEAFETFCDENNKRVEECYYMIWDGVIK